METKICTKCDLVLDISRFRKSGKKLTSTRSECRDCENKVQELFSRTKRGVVTTIYSSQRESSRKRLHHEPSYTKDELSDWITGQDVFHTLFKEWEKSGYDRWKKPSVDRIDNEIGYTMSNIQLMTWKENNDKGVEDLLIKTVYCYTLDGSRLTKYKSTMAAERATGVLAKNIGLVCNGRAQSAGGMIWRYEDKPSLNIDTVSPYGTKSVEQYTLKGEFIKKYSSMKKAEEETGINRSVISKMCRGLQQTAGGYTWKRPLKLTKGDIR